MRWRTERRAVDERRERALRRQREAAVGLRHELLGAGSGHLLGQLARTQVRSAGETATAIDGLKSAESFR